MVLESLINPVEAEIHPNKLLFHGFLYSSIGLLLANWVFNEHTSLVMVFLTSLAAIPLVFNIIKREEKKELTDLSEFNILNEHSRAINVFLNYFIGATLGFAFWYVLLPDHSISEIFLVQTNTILDIRTGGVVGHVTRLSQFSSILANNTKVLIFCILFSFLYGVGAIFILTWNASVIGVAIGETIRRGIIEIEKDLHINLHVHYIGVISHGLFRYVIHGIPEILSYFIAGLAGSIISMAAVRHDFGTKMFEKILLDSTVLLLISFVFVLVAAFLEVYITPMIF